MAVFVSLMMGKINEHHFLVFYCHDPVLHLNGIGLGLEAG